MENFSEAGHRARTRSSQVDARLVELTDRRHELVNTGLNQGSTRRQVERAAWLAALAKRRAIEAGQRTSTARARAADAHERAAELHDMLAEVGVGDPDHHREQAREHRSSAAADRAVATAPFGWVTAS